MGLDGLPDWFIRLAAPAITLPLTHLFNISLDRSTVPTQWKSVRISPVPKVRQPLSSQDYRPIPITPILSRIMEKTLVKSMLYPILTHSDHSDSFIDQYAFRPTGSTTSALIFLFQQITLLLEDHDYIHLIALDFSKAFDTVRHHTLISKFSNFPLPDSLYNWLIDFLQNRSHQTKIGLNESSFLPINASIIQGSGLGPACFIFCASDLHPVHPTNILFKYADDTYLLVPASNSILIPQEIDNVSYWAEANNLKLNTSKSLEMIIRLPNRKHLSIPPPQRYIARVESITVLGVSFTNTLNFSPHICNLTTKAARSLFALKTLRAHGLQGKALFSVTHATLLAQLQYAITSWWGFIGQEHKNKLQSIVSKAIRYGFLPLHFQTLADLVSDAEQALFFSITHNPIHVLHHLLPPIKHTSYNLRARTHSFSLPVSQSNQLRRNFLYHMLYKDIY